MLRQSASMDAEEIAAPITGSIMSNAESCKFSFAASTLTLVEQAQGETASARSTTIANRSKNDRYKAQSIERSIGSFQASFPKVQDSNES